MNTTYTKKACDAIEKAEGSIKRLISDAAMAQDYGAVTRLAELAKSLSVLTSQLSQLKSESGALVGTKQSFSHETAPLSQRKTASNSPSQKGKTRNKKLKKNDYPKFSIERDRLTKTGWSKKRRAEYQHRASQDAVSCVFRKIQNVSVGQAVFTVEDLMPVAGEDGQEVPSYQVYMTLAWLIYDGTLEKQGRDGYRLTMDTKAVSFEAIWQKETKVVS